MLLAPRASTRDTTDFHVGHRVIARPPTLSRPVVGVVVDTWGRHTLVIESVGIEIAVDVEDCETT